MEIKSFILDTNIYSLARRDNPFSVGLLKQANQIYICPIVLAELFSGFKSGSREQENITILDKFLDSPRVVLVDITETTASHYSQIFSNLRANGTPIPTNDMWIAAVAKENGLPVASADEHFSRVPGLLLINPTS